MAKHICSSSMQTAAPDLMHALPLDIGVRGVVERWSSASDFMRDSCGTLAHGSPARKERLSAPEELTESRVAGPFQILSGSARLMSNKKAISADIAAKSGTTRRSRAAIGRF